MVSKTVAVHNHELDPSMSILMRGHRKVSSRLKRQLEANDIAGIRPNRSIKLCEVQAGGPYEIGCLPRDCRNHIVLARRLRLGVGDAEAIRQLFTRLQLSDPRFFYLFDLDDQSRLRNVLWIHPRSRAAYEDFSDVISFDTTYLVNRYEMPFGAFVGVNHHGQSILLGCALVTKEDTLSMKWVFQNWVAAMGGIHPKAVMTDQAESMKAAIRDVLPNAVHRYCLWHILSKLPLKFKGVRDYHRARFEFTNMVYESLTIEAFETKWAAFLVKHRLERNRWLLSLYSERQMWVPVYLNGIFWAGMVSTQRSEGMHAYFDEYLSASSSLKQFMEQYEIAISKKVQKEFMADFDTKTKVMCLMTDFPWEQQFRDAYTNTMFGKVQDEIKRVIYCAIVRMDECDVGNSSGQKYRVLERNIGRNDSIRFVYTVEYRCVGAFLMCNCMKFETMGIICCHILCVMSHRGIQNIHDRYISNRWRKDVFRRHSSIFFSEGYPQMTEDYKKYKECEKVFQGCVDLGVGNAEKFEYINQVLLEMKNVLQNWSINESESSDEGESEGLGNDDTMGGNPMQNPRRTRRRGRPRSSRFMSAAEICRRGRVRLGGASSGGARGGGRAERGGGRAGRGGRGGGRGGGRAGRGGVRGGRAGPSSQPVIDLNDPDDAMDDDGFYATQ